MAFEAHYFEHNHGVIRYYISGSGKPILFLHGGGAKALTYKKVLSLLSEKYSVIAPDLPCFGGSSCPKSTSEYFDLLKNFISTLGNEKIIVVGHSLGGGIALRLARDIPNISQIVVTDSAGIAVKYSSVAFIYKLLIKKSLRELTTYKDPSTMLSMASDLFENVIRKFGEWTKIINILRELLRKDIDGLDRIKYRTLILWGRQDEIFPSVNAEKLQKQIMRSDVIYVDGNHDWCLFRPDVFLDIIVDWLETKG